MPRTLADRAADGIARAFVVIVFVGLLVCAGGLLLLSLDEGERERGGGCFMP